ncbi:MAG TPA: hypothetical protein VIT23_02290 [Terrimicrobiaceae bacterium]
MNYVGIELMAPPPPPFGLACGQSVSLLGSQALLTAASAAALRAEASPSVSLVPLGCVCAAQDERTRPEARIEGNSASGFVQYLKSLGGRSRVVIEACWNWGRVYDTLETIPGVEEVVLAHPLKTRLIAGTQIKTDKLDARALALLLRGGFIARAPRRIAEHGAPALGALSEAPQTEVAPI